MEANPFALPLDRQGFVVLDGGSATSLEARGHVLDDGLWSARLILDAPDEVRAMHRAFLEAGADCITTVGYQASFEGLARRGLDERQIVDALRASVALALDAKRAFLSENAAGGDRVVPIVAASAGPYGAYLADGSEYVGRYGIGRSQLRHFHERRFEVLAESGADLVAFETIPALVEAEAIADILHSSDRWAWVSFTCRDGSRLRDGSALAEAVGVVAGSSARVAGIGVNCTHPRFVDSLLGEAAGATSLPLIAYPNSGERYDRRRRSWSAPAPPRDWSADARRWAELGARVVGGCCRVGSEEVRAIREGLERWAADTAPLPRGNGGT